MITAFDKAVAAALPGVFMWLNQKYGFHLDASPEAVSVIVGFLSMILVYFVPNAKTGT